MTEPAKIRRGCIVPALHYRDAPAAIDWLCKAFGFERNLLVPGENNTIEHAQLKLGSGMIMLGSMAKKGAYGDLTTHPDETGGKVTQSIYVVVDDADAHHARAVAAGAKVILPLSDKDYGGRDYTCRDIEGHVWSFGTYDPWK